MYVDVNEVCEDWGVSRAQGYKMIKELNERMKSINPNLIVLSGKQTKNSTRRIAMVWQKKRKKTFPRQREDNHDLK